MCSLHIPTREEYEEFRRVHGHDMAFTREFNGWDFATARYCPACGLEAIKYLASRAGLSLLTITVDGKPLDEVEVIADPTISQFVQHMITERQIAASKEPKP